MIGRRALACLVFAACGGSDARPDAGFPDAEVPTADAPVGGVSVAVTQRGAPAGGVPVIFQTRASEVITIATTDANGTVGVDEMAANGFVTVLLRDELAGIDQLSTFSSVQPGDMLHLDIDPTGPTATTTVAVTIPESGIANATHELYTSCGGPFGMTPGVATRIVLTGCTGAFGVAVVVTDEVGTRVSALVDDEVLFDENIVVTGPYVSLQARSVRYPMLPTHVQHVQATSVLVAAQGRVLTTPAAENDVREPDNTAVVQLHVPDLAGLGAMTEMLVSHGYPAGGETSAQSIVEWGPVMTGERVVDFANAELPRYALPETYAPFDVAARVVRWPVHPGGTLVPDVARVKLRITRHDVIETRAWTWQLAGTTQNNELAFPQLPRVDGFDLNPVGGDIVSAMELMTATVPGGFATVRETAFETLLRPFGASGRSVIRQRFTPEL